MKILSLLTLLLLLLIPGSANATGGVVPEGMGAWDNGARDPIPMSSALLKWTYDNTFTDVQRDWIMWAFAFVDIQTVDFRLLYGPVANGSQSQIHIDYTNKPVPPGCLIPGQGCVAGETTCGAWGENAGPKYRICNLMRIEINPALLEAYAATRNVDLEKLWIAVLSHEIGHALGLNHSEGGVMNPGVPIVGKDVSELVKFNPCQIAILRDLSIDSSATEWVYTPKPFECSPPPATTTTGAVALKRTFFRSVGTKEKTNSCELVAY